VSQQFSEADVIVSLSQFGTGRLDHAFLYRGSVHFWHPGVGIVIDVMCEGSDEDAARRAFLRTRGWDFRTVTELDVHARQHGWTNWPAQYAIEL
jgi:hypothetical protein